MDRLACVDVYALPLQLLLAKHPEWTQHPAVVVDEDKPQGLILWANEKARAKKILRGMRYAAGLSLDGALRAGVVNEATINASRKRILQTLRHYTPHIDALLGPATGVFILNASGLRRLYPSLEYWARAIAAELKGQGFFANIVVGFERFHTYALAKAHLREPIVVFDDPAREKSVCMQVPLERVLADSKARDTLQKLGVRTVGELVALPESGLQARFGGELAQLWQLCNGVRKEPLANTKEEMPIAGELLLDDAETDSERLLFLLKRLLHPLLDKLAARSEALQTLDVHLDAVVTTLAPAEATLDVSLLLDLARLRLNAITPTLKSGVKRLALVAKGIAAQREQLVLFRETPKRDLRAAERAFARLRAELGDNAVCVAVLRDGHLPEAQFTWQPLQRITTPEPRSKSAQLVRRLENKALLLPNRSPRGPDGWLIGGLELGNVVRLLGPYVISGGWWRGRAIQRDYYFAEVARGDWLWLFFDHTHKAWRQAGQIQ